MIVRLAMTLSIPGLTTKELIPGKTCELVEKTPNGIKATLFDGREVDLPWGSIAWLVHEPECVKQPANDKPPKPAKSLKPARKRQRTARPSRSDWVNA
jgi:hypothetical protein